jgi:hypothetical protein
MARSDPRSLEIWEVENWGDDEWTEQTVAEIAFSKAILNVQYFPDFKIFPEMLEAIGYAGLRMVWCCSLQTTTGTSLWR